MTRRRKVASRFRAARLRPAYRPRVEILEDRLAPGDSVGGAALAALWLGRGSGVSHPQPASAGYRLTAPAPASRDGAPAAARSAGQPAADVARGSTPGVFAHALPGIGSGGAGRLALDDNLSELSPAGFDRSYRPSLPTPAEAEMDRLMASLGDGQRPQGATGGAVSPAPASPARDAGADAKVEQLWRSLNTSGAGRLPGGGGTAAPGGGAIRAGFNTNVLPPNDDGSTDFVPLGFSLSFFCGVTENGLYVNNNGNVTFSNPLGEYTPPPLGSIGQDIIAPFFADVDTRNPASGVVTYGPGTVDGNPAFGVNWVNVGYYNQHADLTNSFQLVLISRPDVAAGAFDIEFNYNQIQWETGDASGGVGGRGGDSARAGYATRDGGTTLELPGSAVNGALLDGGPNALTSHSLGSDVVGRYVFHVGAGSQPPVANDDQFAVGVNDSLSEPAPGVLYNDTSSCGTLSAVPGQGPSNGALALNSDGSFTYTPNPDFSGTDTFTYFASANCVLSAQPATVTIFVVKIDIQMAGVGAGQKLDPGGFVVINANNDNGSAVTNEIPAMRDFDVNPLPGGRNDPDLVQVDVALTPNIPLPGFFQLTVQNLGFGTIRLWNNRNKGAEVTSGVYTTANLPRRFFVKGTEPTQNVRSSIILTYFFIDPLRGVVGVGSDQVNVTVTPVITDFTITPGTVQFAVGADGRSGMNTTGPGAAFSATVTRTGANGNVVYIQNFRGVDNGTNGAAAGWVFTAASGRANRNTQLIGGATFPILDRLAAPPPPDYDVNFARPVDNPNTQRITADDSPSTGFPAGSADLMDIDVIYRIRLFLVWRFPGNIIYTLGFRDWSVTFRADTFVAGRGVTRNVSPNGVAAMPLDQSHPNPVVVAPIFNDRARIV